MNIAFFAVPDILAPLHLLVRRLKADVTRRMHGSTAAAPGLPSRSPASGTATAKPAVMVPPHAQPIVVRRPPPLRVVHVMDGNPARASSGRMVISGRMADVCAELDRLAAREATLH
jgi:hypothetical protein